MQDEPSAVDAAGRDALSGFIIACMTILLMVVKSNAEKKKALKAFKLDLENKRDAAIHLAKSNSDRALV